MWSYAMDELVDPSIDDEWCVLPSLQACLSNILTFCSTRKCVMICAYSNANPQVAALWSANISDWGVFHVPEL
jgi:endo-1,3(4)-beta-glucanase